MPQLSEQAQKLIQYFEDTINTVPTKERDAVLKRMTSHIAALNEEAMGLYKSLQGPGAAPDDDIDQIRDAM